jgi:hypothetical protein
MRVVGSEKDAAIGSDAGQNERFHVQRTVATPLTQSHKTPNFSV